MKPIDIFNLNPSSRVLIEASAGTGKTFTIAGLFARFIAEGRCKADELLVVTFTKAATKELKARIYERLRNCRELLSDTNQPDPDKYGKDFLQSFKDNRKALERIQKAIANFDEVTISTIHGFCQSVLNEYLLLSRIPVKWELEENNLLLEEIVKDYWRRFVGDCNDSAYDELLFEFFSKIAESPEKLFKLVDSIISNPHAVIEPDRRTLCEPEPFFKEILSVKDRIKVIWEKDKEEIYRELVESNLSGFTQRNLNKWSSDIDGIVWTNNPDYINSKYLDKFCASYQDNPDNYKKGGRQHFFDREFYKLCDRLLILSESLEEAKTAFLLEILESVQKEYEAKRETRSTFSYDDLLNVMAKSLNGPNGNYFAEILRNKFPVALVDEFQDTDPVQYEIFSSIYQKKDKSVSLIMIGDPKQAIYEFRGADVFAYMQARNDADKESRFTLHYNYRSNPGVINSVNKLFSNKKDALILDNFYFSDAGHGNVEKRLLQNGKEIPPMQLIINRHEEERFQNKSQLRKAIYRDVSRRIALLIKDGADELLTIDDKPLEAGDITVLVNSHKEGDNIKDQLKKLHIRSVKISRQNVFSSPEAYRIQLLLEGVTDSGNTNAIRKLMMSGFRGLNLSEFPDGDDEKLNILLEELDFFRIRMMNDGFYPAFRWLLFEKKGLSMISELDHTDRVISNIFQIAELCNRAEQKHSFQPEGLLRWLSKKRKEETITRDEDQLRLENDSELVKIITIHNSKGLSYPVVFAPFLWNTTQMKTELPVSYHRKKEYEYARVLNYSYFQSTQKKVALREALIEKTAEEVRKSYVAITRARYANFIYWGVTQDTCYSGLGAILSGREKLEPYFNSGVNLKNGTGDLHPHYYSSCLEELSETHPDLFSLSVLNDQLLDKAEPAKVEPGVFRSKSFDAIHRLKPGKSLFSFSSLMLRESDSVYKPDYDEWTTGIVRDEPVDISQPFSLFQFPRGAVAGTIIHKVFESQIFGDKEKAKLPETVEKLLNVNRLDQKWSACLLKMIEDVNQTALPASEDDVIYLSKLGEEDQLSEMEFQLKSNEPDPHDLIKLIRNGSFKLKERKSNIQSFMKGFIDLIVWQNDKAYIIDYKSNYLGDEFNDYKTEKLLEEMKDKSYDIQYHFYTLALSKYLEKRIPGYDYAKHFGGVFYLFVRGIHPGGKTGIYFHKPAKQNIQTLENWLIKKAW